MSPCSSDYITSRNVIWLDALRGVLRVVVEEPLNCLQSLTLPRMTQRILREEHFANFLKYLFSIDLVMICAAFPFPYVAVLKKVSAELDDLSIFHCYCKERFSIIAARFESERALTVENSR